jgi:hypothetical protein
VSNSKLIWSTIYLRLTCSLFCSLKITNEDCYDDRFGGFESRKQLCKSVSLQVCFYVACALRSFIDKTRAPVLLVLGAGHSGSIVVEMLVKCGCAQFLRIHCRGDYSAKHWTAKKLQSDTSLEGLLQGQKADIVVLCSPLSSFSTIGRILRRYVAPNTFLISTTFGLTRRRICSVLHISSVFRTYQEPVSLLKRVNDAYKSNPLSKKRRSKSERTPGEQHSDVSSGTLRKTTVTSFLTVYIAISPYFHLFLYFKYFPFRNHTHRQQWGRFIRRGR